jgi:DNA-binding GntR family transcriptional regulator
MGPIRPVPLSDRVYEEVEAAIIRGELGPGRVLTDRQVAELLDVSRTPVREALQRLGATGLVLPRNRGGWEVAGFHRDDLRELFELRRVLEPLGLEALLKNPDDDVIRELSGFFDDFPSQITKMQYPRYFVRDHAFHKRIVECSGNRRVIGFYEIIEKQIDRGRHFLSTGYEGRVDENYAEHLAICAAIGERDLVRACSALLHHLRKGEELMMSFVQEQQNTAREAVEQTHDAE